MIGDKKIIAVCVAKIHNNACNDFITALNEVVTPAGFHIVVYNTGGTVDTEDGEDVNFYIYDLMDYSVIDVVIICEETLQNPKAVEYIIGQAKKREIPVIVYGGRHEGCINIRFAQEEGFYQIVCHMIEEHHMTKLHFMAGMRNNSFSDHRKSVFRKALEEHGLVYDENNVSYGDFWSVPAMEETEKIVASGNLPEAIICANDKMAIAVCGVLNKHGIKIPEQVAVTGFDGVPEIEFSSPRITSASCSEKDMAEKTLELLLTMDNWKGCTKSIYVPSRLILAESCGCKEKKPVDASVYLNSINDRFFLYQEEALKLSQITAKVQRCDSLDQIVEQLRDSMFYDMCCVLEKSCLDETANPEECFIEKKKVEEKEMVLLYDSNHTQDFHPYPFPLKQLVPGLDYCLDTNRVIVITALQHMGVPLGYVSFCFRSLDHAQSSRVTQIANALNTALGGYRNMRYRHFLMDQIEEMYRFDGLTGLYNRRGFALAYQKLLESGKAKETQLTIILADLDRLKYINDTFGHKEGDFAIKATAQALQTVCPPDALCTRFGGDEMLAVCCGKMEPESIKAAFISFFQEFNKTSGKDYEVEASIGIYITKENDVLSFDELIERSDRLMYEEKERHRKKMEK